VGTVGAVLATQCALGTYQPNSDQSSCSNAPAGSFVGTVGAVSATQCALGTYQPNPGQSSCLNAPAGSFVGTVGAVSTTECALGTDQPSTGQSSCIAAPIGSYVAAIGATAATPCPAGTTTATTGSTSSADCRAPSTPPTILAAPGSTRPPVIAGTARANRSLSCAPGEWTGAPTRYSYQWSRDGTAIQGASDPVYTVQTIDEGSSLSCAVSAANAAGTSAAATSAVVDVAVPHIRGCPAATGRLVGVQLGLIRLGLTRAQARRAFAHSSRRGFVYKDFFCLTPRGIRVGYASPKLLHILPTSAARLLSQRVVWASTSNPYYAIDGIRYGTTLSAAEQRLPHGTLLHIGLNDWYLAPAGSATAVLKVRHSLVEEVGIADRRLTQTRRDRLIVMESFY
jgi:hypothetical protein